MSSPSFPFLPFPFPFSCLSFVFKLHIRKGKENKEKFTNQVSERAHQKKSLFGDPRSMMTHLNSVESICQGKGSNHPKQKESGNQIPRPRALRVLWTREKELSSQRRTQQEPRVPSLHLQASGAPSCTHSSNKSLQNSLKCFKTSGANYSLCLD